MSGTDAIRWDEARRWLAKAIEDSRSAEALLGIEPPLLDPAAYHCQQAAEKMLKALLAAAGAAIPKVHDLQRLAALVLPHHPLLAGEIARVTDLTPWGTATRYPDLDCDLGVMPEDIRDALITLERLRSAIAALAP
jgi:HEPN domain-containing protein